MITANNIFKIYNESQGDEIRALNGVSLNIDTCKSVCILGKSGCGKSTLLHILSGLDKPTSGNVIIDQINITEMSENQLSLYRRENIGFVFQSYNLVPELNIKENIIFPALLAGKSFDNDYFEYLMNSLEIYDRLKHLPGECSGGQQQRAAIARALINKPKLIFCDEPTGNLDFASSEKVKKALFSIHNEHKSTLIVVTHDSDFANLCDQTIILQDGKIKGEA